MIKKTFFLGSIFACTMMLAGCFNCDRCCKHKKKSAHNKHNIEQQVEPKKDSSAHVQNLKKQHPEEPKHHDAQPLDLSKKATTDATTKKAAQPKKAAAPKLPALKK